VLAPAGSWWQEKNGSDFPERSYSLEQLVDPRLQHWATVKGGGSMAVPGKQSNVMVRYKRLWSKLR